MKVGNYPKIDLKTSQSVNVESIMTQRVSYKQTLPVA